MAQGKTDAGEKGLTTWNTLFSCSLGLISRSELLLPSMGVLGSSEYRACVAARDGPGVSAQGYRRPTNYTFGELYVSQPLDGPVQSTPFARRRGDAELRHQLLKGARSRLGGHAEQDGRLSSDHLLRRAWLRTRRLRFGQYLADPLLRHPHPLGYLPKKVPLFSCRDYSRSPVARWGTGISSG